MAEIGQAERPDRILRIREVIRRGGESRTTIWRKVRAGTFPAPVQLSEGGGVGWWESEVEATLKAYPRVSYAPQPAEPEPAAARIETTSSNSSSLPVLSQAGGRALPNPSDPRAPDRHGTARRQRRNEAGKTASVRLSGVRSDE